jgi:hypothetical protein
MFAIILIQLNERETGIGPAPQPLAPTPIPERETGIGPAPQPWEGCVLPLYYSRIVGVGVKNSCLLPLYYSRIISFEIKKGDAFYYSITLVIII